MLLENKFNLKKSWQILKGIINKRKYRSAVQEFDNHGIIINDGAQIADRCIAMPRAHVCNLSFKRGVFPMELKNCKCGSYIQKRKWTCVFKLPPCFSATSFLEITGKTDLYQIDEFYNKQ